MPPFSCAFPDVPSDPPIFDVLSLTVFLPLLHPPFVTLHSQVLPHIPTSSSTTLCSSKVSPDSTSEAPPSPQVSPPGDHWVPAPCVPHKCPQICLHALFTGSPLPPLPNLFNPPSSLSYLQLLLRPPPPRVPWTGPMISVALCPHVPFLCSQSPLTFPLRSPPSLPSLGHCDWTAGH